jgi:chromosome segregation ATPase
VQKNPRKRAAAVDLEDEYDEESSPIGTVGLIEHIQLTNFMCHANLAYEPGPQINFITGANGSGKSAILVGLALCLGASAAFAQRSSKLAGFVKEGANKAVIAVTLSNRGIESYKPEIYGDTITVERSILSSGSSKFRFRNSSNKVVSEDRSELVPLSDRFNIQVNNPVIIMMQESSRDFLGTSTAHKKYELFERATQISTIKDQLAEMLSDLSAGMSTLERKKELMPKLESSFRNAKKDMEEAEHLRDIADNMNTIKQELIWAQIEEREAEVQTLKESVERLSGQLTRNVAQVEKVEATAEALATEEKELAQKMLDMQHENDEVEAEFTKARSQHQALCRTRDQEKKKGKVLPEAIEKLENRIQRLDNNIADERAKALGDQGSEQAKILERLQIRKQELLEVRQELTRVEREHDSSVRSKRNKQDEIHGLNSRLSSLSHEVQKLTDRIKNYQMAEKDPSAV